MKRHLCVILFVNFYLLGISQVYNELNYKLESVVSYGKGRHNAFWLISNHYGKGSLEKKSAYLNITVNYPGKINENLSYKFGLDIVGAYNHTANFFVHQAYGEVIYRNMLVTIGSKEYAMALKNPLLSSGGMTFSTNARPIPQVKIGTEDYITLWSGTPWFQLKGHVAYGRFTDDNFQKSFAEGKSKYNRGVLYHSKALFMKFEGQRVPLVFEGGLEMEAQFGGRIYNKNGEITSKIPSRFIDFLKVLIPMSGDEETTGADQVNVYGNHLGSWHASLAYAKERYRIRFYYEHFFEDHSQMFWQYGFWKDGLVGVEVGLLDFNWINGFVYEYIGTKDQTGPFLHDETDRIPDQISGNDNYYNHCSYSSWSHWGMGLGNPLIFSPVYNVNGDLSFRSNRMKAHHIGIKGQIFDVGYRVLFSHARHWGTYHNPLREVEINMHGMGEISYSPFKWKNWAFIFALGVDKSKLLGKNGSGMLTIRFSK